MTEESLGGAVLDSLSSPLGIAIQVLAVGALVALLRVDWTRVLGQAASGAQGAADR